MCIYVFAVYKNPDRKANVRAHVASMRYSSVIVCTDLLGKCTDLKYVRLFKRWGLLNSSDELPSIWQSSIQMQSQVSHSSQILHSLTQSVTEPHSILQLFWDVAAVASVLMYLSSFHKKKAMPSMRQGISDFKEVRNMSEKSWGTNGLMPTPPPAGCCPNPGVFWGISPNVGSRRQFFPARSHQFLSEESPSNVLPFCCAVTCVISQFIALWAGSFYHERFLSASFTLCSFAPTVVLSPLCSALFAAAEVLWQDHSGDTMWSQFTRLINPPSPFIMYWNLFLSVPSPKLWAW